MREIPRQEPVPAPRAAELAVESRRVARMLRLGYQDAALPQLALLTTQIAPGLGELARRAGAAMEPSPLPQALAYLESLSLAQARGDLVAVADTLEHQLAPLIEAAAR